MITSCGKKVVPDGVEAASAGGRVIVETGELAAVNSQAFVLQRYGRYWYEMRLIGILPHGTMVQEGDSIIQLDPTDINKFIIERESSLETELANLEKMYVDQANSMNDYNSQIKSEEASFDLKKLELEASRFESDRTRRIKQLEFQQAEIRLAKERRKHELAKKINACNLKIQQINVSRVRNEIEDARSLIPQLTIRTPITGVFQIGHNYRTGNSFKVSDSAYPGQNMGNVPELRHMKVNTQVNETDFLRVHLGQKVTVRLDALPSVAFDGEVAYIGKLCHRKNGDSKQKVFDVEVRLLQPDERLKPGMTVSCEYRE